MELPQANKKDDIREKNKQYDEDLKEFFIKLRVLILSNKKEIIDPETVHYDYPETMEEVSTSWIRGCFDDIMNENFK